MTRTRQIHVDGVDYHWTTRFADASHVAVRVWLGRRGRVLDVLVPFHDPWLHFGELLNAPDQAREVLALTPVTPSLVEHIIRTSQANGWHPTETGAAVHFTLDRDHLTLTKMWSQDSTRPR